MRAIKKNYEDIFIIILIVFFTVGLIFHIIPATYKYVLFITDISMLVTNSVVMYFILRAQADKKLFFWSILTFLLTYITELAGIKTGAIFGNYEYGETMLIQVLNVPVVIAMNWVILIIGSYSIVQRANLKTMFIPVISSIIVVGFDFVMEEVAMKLDYWQWENNIVPLQNYFAWFIISLFFTSMLAVLKLRIENRIVQIYFLIQLLFFIGLRLFLN